MRTLNDVIESMRLKLRAMGSNLYKFSNYSNIYAILRTVATTLLEQDTRINNLSSNLFIATAIGNQLDLRASDYSIYRNKGSKATGYVLISGGNPVMLPKGLILSNPQQALEFELTKSANISTYEQAVPIISISSTSLANLAPGTKLYSNIYPNLSFIIGAYRDPITKRARQGLSGGSNKESDQAFRTRILNMIAGAYTLLGTKSAIKQALLKVSYVNKVYIIESDPYPGYITIYTNVSDAESITYLSTLVEQVKPVGIHYRFRPIIIKPISLKLELSISSNNTQNIKSIANDAINNYLDQVIMNGVIELDSIKETLLSVPNIRKVIIKEPTHNIRLINNSVPLLANLSISVGLSN